jgi:hypothetical protein
MRLAYADPPYVGQARKYYIDDPKCQEVDQKALVEQLMTYDGWALSLSSPSLREIIGYCPPKVRVGAWVKPFTPFRVGVDPGYAWEPVLFMPARKGSLKGRPTSKDWVSASPVRSGSRTQQGGVTGRKPPEFCVWLFNIMRAEQGDSLDDLFPGSGAVSDAWYEFANGLRIV